MFSACICFMLVGCAEDIHDPLTESDIKSMLSGGLMNNSIPPGKIISTDPADGSTIVPDGILTITFDNPVEIVTVTPGFVVSQSIDGITWTAKGQNIKVGKPDTTAPKVDNVVFVDAAGNSNISVNITWVNKDNSSGNHRINLRIQLSKVNNIAGPKVVSSSPKDGESGVDPAKVFKLTVEFDEAVTVSGVKFAAVGGDALTIKVEAKDKVVEIAFLGGTKLTNETKYEITGRAKDTSGNEKEFKITFETKRLA